MPENGGRLGDRTLLILRVVQASSLDDSSPMAIPSGAAPLLGLLPHSINSRSQLAAIWVGITRVKMVDRDRVARSSGACRAPVLADRRTIQNGCSGTTRTCIRGVNSTPLYFGATEQ